MLVARFIRVVPKIGTQTHFYHLQRLMVKELITLPEA